MLTWESMGNDSLLEGASSGHYKNCRFCCNTVCQLQRSPLGPNFEPETDKSNASQESYAIGPQPVMLSKETRGVIGQISRNKNVNKECPLNQ